MFRLLTTFYIDESFARQIELETSIKNNLANTLLETTFIVDSIIAKNKLLELGATNIIIQEKRPTYKDFIKVANSFEDIDITIIANTDIYFPKDSLSLISENLKPNEAYALSRYDMDIYNKLTLFSRIDSQDTWCFKGRIRDFYCDFYLGVPGCDNRIAHEINSASYVLYNPCHDIITIHLHNSMVRKYLVIRTTSIPPPYLMLQQEGVRK